MKGPNFVPPKYRTSNNQMLRNAGDNDRRSKRFCPNNAML